MKQYSEKVAGFLQAMTVAEKIKLLSTKQSAVERLGIGAYQVGGEAAHGVVDREGKKTTSFPVPLGLSQTWNPRLLEKVGTAIGTEARIKYLQSGKASWLTLWAPTIDMERDPRWGRNEEAYGEDPQLVRELATAIVSGMQGKEPGYLLMAAAPKHFFGNNNEAGRENTSNFIPLRAQEEYYLQPFQAVFQQGKAQSMMTAYNGVNGIPGMQLPELKEKVKGQWQMDGFIVSDGGALTLNVEEYHYYDTFAEALADSLKKGVDCFVDDKALVEQAATEALQQGLITEANIDEAIGNCLTVRERLGHFGQCPYDQVDQSLLNSAAHQELCEKVTAEGMVLLKNDGVLPFTGKEKIAVIGPLADNTPRDWYGGFGNGRSTIKDGLEKKFASRLVGVCDSHDQVAIFLNNQPLVVQNERLQVGENHQQPAIFVKEIWQDNTFVLKELASGRYLAYDEEAGYFKLHQTEVYDWFIKELWQETPEGMQNWQGDFLGVDEKGVVTVTGEVGDFTLKVIKNGLQAAEELAAKSQWSIVVLGNHPMINGKETQDRQNLNLPEFQQTLLKKVLAKNPQTILVLLGSYPFDLRWAQEHVPGIFFVTHGSQALGKVFGDVLVDQKQLTGHLTQTWFTSADCLPAMNDYDLIKHPRTYHYYRDEVLYPFGFGLSYHSLRLDHFLYLGESGEDLRFSVGLINDSDECGKETIQVYLKEKQTHLLLPRKLVAFKKVKVLQNSQKIIELTVAKKALTYFDVRSQKHQPISGELEFFVGFNSEDQQFTTLVPPLVEACIPTREVAESLELFSFDSYQLAEIIACNHQRVLSLAPGGKVSYLANHFSYGSYCMECHAETAGKIIINGEVTELIAGENQVMIKLAADADLVIASEILLAVSRFTKA